MICKDTICRFKCFTGIHLPFSMQTPGHYFSTNAGIDVMVFSNSRILTIIIYISDPSDSLIWKWFRWRHVVSSLASTVNDSGSDDDVFLGPIASWFVLIDDRLQIKPIPNTDMVYLHEVSSINKYIDCLYVTNLTFRCTSDRFFACAEVVIRSLESRFRGQKIAHWRNNLACLLNIYRYP